MNPPVTKLHFGSRLNPLGDFAGAGWERLRPKWKQVHGTGIAEVRSAGQAIGDVDGIWTRTPGLPVGVVTADCVPILLERIDARAVAALHAGWRGTLGKIVESFFKALPAELSEPAEWRAAIGPCIRACCYQTGEDLIERFAAAFPEIPQKELEPSKRMLDLVAVNRAELMRLGAIVPFVHPDCTACAKEGGEFKYFSYRRGDRDARQYSMISLSSIK
jgi:YfiH family protein